MAHDAHVQRARQDMLALFSKYRPVESDMTLPDVLARGLVDNLDHRLALMEQTLEENRLSLVQYDMLPSLALDAGYDWRDKEAASTSISLLTGTPSLQPSYSSEKSGVDASLRFSWNLLDFGLSYFQAKQQADRALIAVETRRRVINTTTRDVISAYYRALSAEKLLPRVRRGIANTDRAIAASDKVSEEKLVPAAQMLTYKRDLLQYALLLRNHEAALQRSREELATLINVPVDQLRLADVKMPRLSKVKTELAQLQDYALVNRAELREEAYRERIDRQTVHQETLRMFPGLSAISSLNYDSNKFLYYSNWRELGLRATWNLFDVLKTVQAKKIAETQVEYTQMRRVALSAAIMAQTAISYYQYEEARATNRTAAALSDVERKLLKAARDAEEAQSGSVLERMRQEAASISAQIEADRSYAEAQTALASLLVSVGYDLVPASVDMDDPAALATHVAPMITALQEGRLPALKPVDAVRSVSATEEDVEKANAEMQAAASVEAAGSQNGGKEKGRGLGAVFPWMNNKESVDTVETHAVPAPAAAAMSPASSAASPSDGRAEQGAGVTGAAADAQSSSVTTVVPALNIREPHAEASESVSTPSRQTKEDIKKVKNVDVRKADVQSMAASTEGVSSSVPATVPPAKALSSHVVADTDDLILRAAPANINKARQMEQAEMRFMAVAPCDAAAEVCVP